MAEFKTVNSGQSLHYQGYLNFGGLYKLIRELVEKRGYAYMEQEHNELVKENGKHIHLLVDADKPLSEYAKTRLVISINARDLTQATIEHEDNSKQVVDEAKIELQIQAFVITDYQGRYQKTAWKFFFRSMLEKFFFEREIKKFSTLVEKDLQDVLSEAKKYLNVFSA